MLPKQFDVGRQDRVVARHIHVDVPGIFRADVKPVRVVERACIDPTGLGETLNVRYSFVPHVWQKWMWTSLPLPAERRS